MSSAKPEYNWLWCDDNQKVTDWFLSEPDRHGYAFFYSSFINAANRTWLISIDTKPRAKKLPAHELFILDCLCKKPIPAAMLIEALKKYNKYIGGTKGDLKGKGLIKFKDDAPGMFISALIGSSGATLMISLYRYPCYQRWRERALPPDRKVPQEARRHSI